MTSASRSLFRRLTWALACLGGLMVLALLAATLWLPGWVTGPGARLASEKLGRPVEIERVQFQPWRLGLVVEGLHIAGHSQADPPLLRLERLDAALSLRSLLRGRWVVASVALSRPALQFSRTADGHYDIDDVLERFAQPAPAGDAPAEFAVYNLSIAEGDIVLNDRPAQRVHRIGDLQLSLPFLSTLRSDVEVKLLPELRGHLDGVPFASRAELLPFAEDHRARLTLQFDGFDLAPLAPYLPTDLPVQLKSGRLDLNLAVDFSEPPRQPPALRLSGLVQLHDLRLDQPNGQPLFSIRRLRLPLADVQPLRRQLALGKVELDAPDLKWPQQEPAPGSAGTSAGAPWQVSSTGAVLKGGRLAFRDLALDDIELQLGAAAWPLQSATQLDASLRLGAATLQAQARLSPQQLDVEGSLDGLALDRLSAWLPLPPGVRLNAGLSSRWSASAAQPLAPGVADRLALGLRDLRLSNVRVALPGQPGLASLVSVQLDSARIDLGQRSVDLGPLQLQAPRLRLARRADGQLNLAALMPQPAPAAAPGQAWRVQLASLGISRGSLQWHDGAASAALPPVAVALEPIELSLGALAWPAKGPVNLQVTSQLAPLDGQEQVSKASAGSLQWRGRVGLAPLSAQGSLQTQALPLHLFNAYLDPAWGLQLQRAELGLRAEVAAREQPAGWAAQIAGDVRIAPLALLQARVADGQRVVGEDLLSWQSLQLGGLQLAVTPGGAPRLTVKEALLDDAYARLIVDEQGRFNLRDIRKGEAHAPVATAAASQDAGAPPLEFAVQRIQLNRGIVDFTDRFVRPNYSARLSELQGTLGAFSSAESALAPLTVRGRIAGTGLLEIDGRLKPGAPLAMDIAANATDIELAPLSPYAAKYAGYAIERGKLSTRLRYQVEPGGQLQAANQLILNQLTFGERVDSPEATSLPVRFAVALLKDRDGVIDVNLPISGSLNDPEFKVGGLIWKLVLNLVGKALTAPFSLLTGGDGTEEARIDFEPARSELAAVDTLDRIARLLVDRPGVQLTLTGWAGTAAETRALSELGLERALRAETAPTPEAALKRLYQARQNPKRPRNVLGLLKDVPAEQMRGMLLDTFPVDAEALRQLALARATAVRDALLARGVPNARVFLAAPKLCEQACDAAWRPHVELSLGAH